MKKARPVIYKLFPYLSLCITFFLLMPFSAKHQILSHRSSHCISCVEFLLSSSCYLQVSKDGFPPDPHTSKHCTGTDILTKYRCGTLCCIIIGSNGCLNVIVFIMYISPLFSESLWESLCVVVSLWQREKSAIT